jgi:YggT family protein
MIILQRIYWLINSAVVTVIVVTIALVLLRFIANLADLNPFSWASRTIRRVTDPLIAPVRRPLARAGVDPKYAPLVTILVTIFLGWCLLQFVAAATGILDGLLRSLAGHAVVPFIGYLIYGLLSFYTLLIFARVLFSWVNLSYSNRWARFLIHATEPLLGPLRRLVPIVGGFDISPIIAWLIIEILKHAVLVTLINRS